MQSDVIETLLNTLPQTGITGKQTAGGTVNKKECSKMRHSASQTRRTAILID
jgi:hypothetical protein